MLNARRVLLLIVLFITAACASAAPTATPLPSDTPTPEPSATPAPPPTAAPALIPLTDDPAQQAFVRVVHAAQDAPAVDVYIDGLLLAPYLGFRQYTEPSPIAAGSYTLRVYPAGSRPGDAVPIIELPINTRPGESRLVVAFGPPDNLTLAVLPEETEPLDEDQSRVSFINALPGAAEITVQQRGLNLTPALRPGERGAILSTPAGDITFDFQSTDSTLLSYPLTMRSRIAYTLLVTGRDTPEILRIEARVPARTDARIINAANIGPVDVYLGDTLLASALDYTRVTARERITAGAYRASVYRAGADRAASEPLATAEVIISEESGSNLVILGSESSQRLLLFRENLTPTAPNRGRLTLINTLESAPRLRADVLGPPFSIPDLGYGDTPQVTDVTAGSVYTFIWSPVEAGEVGEGVEVARDAVFEAGRSYLYLITGRIDAPPVIISENIGVVPELVSAQSDTTPSPTPLRPTTIRVVHAVFNTGPLDLLLDGTPAASDLSYGDSTAVQPATDGARSVEVRASGSADVLYQSIAIIEPGFSYTLVLYGTGIDSILVLPVPDPGVSLGDPPLARLINLTLDSEITLGLAYAASAPASGEASRFSTAPQASELSGTPVTPTYRQSISFGVQIIPNLDSVPRGGFSAPGLLPEGIYDLLILDTDAASIAATIPRVNLEPGQRYDVFALQQPDSRIVQGFVVQTANPG